MQLFLRRNRVDPQLSPFAREWNLKQNKNKIECSVCTGPMKTTSWKKDKHRLAVECEDCGHTYPI